MSVVALALLATSAASAERSMVMTADPGTYSGVGEGHYVLEQMTAKVNISDKLPYCSEAVEGLLFGSPVTMVCTGIGHDNAAGCTVNLVEYYKQQSVVIKDVTYLGTSGWSPKLGGFFNPEVDPECKNGPSMDTGLIGIGDICISPQTFLLNCGFCDWNDKSVGECAAPSCTAHDESSVFSQCDFHSNDYTLASELIEASKTIEFPAKNANLKKYLTDYWNATWAGLGVQSSKQPSPTPTVYDHRTCGEGASYNLWKGIPDDFRCRKYLSALITKATGVQTGPSEVVCVSAMEGPGWMRVLLNKASQGGVIPFANVRGASNYDAWPVTRGTGGVLLRNDNWLPGGTDNFTLEGYAYAIKTASSVILQMFRSRSEVY